MYKHIYNTSSTSLRKERWKPGKSLNLLLSNLLKYLHPNPVFLLLLTQINHQILLYLLIPLYPIYMRIFILQFSLASTVSSISSLYFSLSVSIQTCSSISSWNKKTNLSWLPLYMAFNCYCVFLLLLTM
jgi:hypothetical protein